MKRLCKLIRISSASQITSAVQLEWIVGYSETDATATALGVGVLLQSPSERNGREAAAVKPGSCTLVDIPLR